MKKSQMHTREEIIELGLDALARELGMVGMIRFMQEFDKGRGDYTKERRKWIDSLDGSSIDQEIRKMRVRKPPTRKVRKAV